MKTLFLFTLILSTSLFARQNPFVPTNSYEEEHGQIIEEYQYNQNISEEEYIQEMQQKMNALNPKNENKNEVINKKTEQKKANEIVMKKEEKKLSKEEVKKLITASQKKLEKETKALKKELEKVKNKKPEQIVFVKPRTDVISEEDMLGKELKTLKPLDFVEITYNDEMLTVSSKYTLIKKFLLEESNKMVLDFKANVKFYTKKEQLNSKSFESIAIGNHQKSKFFRVVIKLKNKTSMYKESFEDSIFTISKK